MVYVTVMLSWTRFGHSVKSEKTSFRFKLEFACARVFWFFFLGELFQSSGPG